MLSEPVTEFELDAYVDGELDLARRLDVENHLVGNPEAAARVLADLRTRTVLNLMQQPLERPSSALVAAARRLGGSSGAGAGSTQAPWKALRRPAIAAVGIAAALALILLPTPDLQARPPRYIADAVMAYRTNLLRVAMTSQVETLVFDPGDVRRFTSIRVPTLPVGWKIRDVQIFPSDEGPALQLLVETDTAKTVSVFAVRSSERAPARPVTIRRGDTSVAYWRHGAVGYALIGVEPPDALDIAAEDLADNRLD